MRCPVCIIGFILMIMGVLAMLLDAYEHKKHLTNPIAFGIYPLAGGIGLFLLGIIFMIICHR